MDSELIDIPIVDDDQGEGFVDPIDAEENFLEKLQRESWKIDEKLRRKRK